MKNNSRIRIGGLKILEGGACVVSSSLPDERRLSDQICGPLALSRINLSFMTHVAGDRDVVCTATEVGEAAFTLMQSHAAPESAHRLEPGTAILSVYPHDKRPEIIGTFIRALAQARVVTYGLASSPSAISTVLSHRRRQPAIEQLFRHFDFAGFASPADFYAAQGPPEEYVQKVVATYQEKVIKVYWILPQPDLDLWGINIQSSAILGGFAKALMDLAALQLKIPFLVALPGLEGKEFIVSFSTMGEPGAPDQGSEIRRILRHHLPEARPMHLAPVAGIFLHGPHFGDRYGIVHTLTAALKNANISLLALSCTISSISLIIRQHELAAAQVILGKTFAAPVEYPQPAPTQPQRSRREDSQN